MKIGGKDRPIKFGLNQSILYCELRKINISEMNKDFSKIANGGTGSEIRDLVWSALKDGARYEKTDFKFTNLDVGDWFDSIEEGEMEKFLQELLDSMPNKDVKKKK